MTCIFLVEMMVKDLFFIRGLIYFLMYIYEMYICSSLMMCLWLLFFFIMDFIYL